MMDVGVVTLQTGKVRVSHALARGAAQGFAWGVMARLWMRLISEDPEFSWGGTIYIVAAATIFGLTTGLANAARRNGWRPVPRRVVTSIAGISVILLGMGAGAITLPTIVVGGLVLARPTFGLTVRLVTVAFVALLGIGVGGSTDSSLLIGIVAVVVVSGLLIAGYRTRMVMTGLALLPVVFVVWIVLFEAGPLPMWQRLTGTALYVPLLLPLAVWFARTIAPLQPAAASPPGGAVSVAA